VKRLKLNQARKSVFILVQNIYDSDVRVRRKAEALVSEGYDVDVLALRPPGSISRDYRLNGVHVYTLSLGKKRGSKGRYYFEYIVFFLWAFLKSSFGLRKKAYDVVDVNTLPDFLIFAAFFQKLRGALLLLDMHEIFPEFLISKYGCEATHWQVRLARFLERVSFNFADHVIVINEPILRLLESRGLALRKSTIIMNSADENLFVAGQKLNKAINLASGYRKFVMMYHGTITRIYGLEIALHAFSQVQADIPNAVFWIVGDGPEKAELEKLTKKLHLESKVSFIDEVQPQDISQYLKRCDVGILPTRQDVFLDLSFPNKLAELIVLGKPVIASRLRGIRRYFSEDAIVYFEPNSISDLAKQMVVVYEDKGLRDRSVLNASKEYEPINWEVMRKRYLNLVGNLATRTSVRAQASSLI
jgi:glycosyltransferase involved in cell wall biosynthesis